MKILIDIPEDTYNAIQENYYCGILNSDMYNAIKNGKPIPDDCEILTKEAYADLCLRAAKAEQEESKRFIDCDAAEKTPNGTCSGYGYVYSEDDYYGDEPIPKCEKCPNFGGLKDEEMDFAQPNEEMFEMTIKALEQEKCEDCISREQTLIDIVNNTHLDSYDLSEALNVIENMPSVKPKAKTGKWLKNNEGVYANFRRCSIHDAPYPYDNTPNFCRIAVQKWKARTKNEKRN